jgi:hypothetical protein
LLALGPHHVAVQGDRVLDIAPTDNRGAPVGRSLNGLSDLDRAT